MFFRRGYSAFTLLEVIVALSVLIVGITASTRVYTLILKWSEEVRVDMTALETGRTALYNAAVLTDRQGNVKSHKNDDVQAAGWLNVYYVVREIDETKTKILPDEYGKYVHISIRVYYGGDDTDGALVHSLESREIIAQVDDP